MLAIEPKTSEFNNYVTGLEVLWEFKWTPIIGKITYLYIGFYIKFVYLYITEFIS